MSVRCLYPFNNLKIDSHGNVFNCCYQKIPLGNIFIKNIEEIINNATNNNIKSYLLNNKFHHNCINSLGCPKMILHKNYCINTNEIESIEIELPNYSCNIGGPAPTKFTACLMCPRSSLNFIPQNDNLTYKILDKIKPYLSTLKTLKITGLAEPFYKKNIFNILNYINYKAFKNTLKIDIITNCTLLNKTIITNFLKEVPHGNVTFSIDAGTKETYSKIRIYKNFNKVINNIKTFNELKPETIISKINVNLNTLNIYEYEKIIEIASKTMTNYIVFRPTIIEYNPENLSQIALKSIPANKLNEIEDKIKKYSLKHNVTSSFIVPLSSVHL